jgi:F0F1-type ATP synthase assembly protein I
MFKVQGRKMKTKMLAVSLWLVIIACPVAAQTAKLQVAYPATVGSIAGMTKETKLFERQGLDRSDYRCELFERAGAGRFIKKLYGE